LPVAVIDRGYLPKVLGRESSKFFWIKEKESKKRNRKAGSAALNETLSTKKGCCKVGEPRDNDPSSPKDNEECTKSLEPEFKR